MAESNSLIPLMIQQPDIGRTMMQAGQINAQQTQNSLSQLALEQGVDDRNALQQFKTSGDVNDLSGSPDIYAKMVAARGQMDTQRRQNFDENVLRTAKDAQFVAGLTDPAERSAAWKERIDKAFKDKRLDEPTYQRLSTMPVNDLSLHNLVKAGLTLEQAVTLEQKDKDRATGNAAIGAIGTILGGGTPAAGPGGAPGASPAQAATPRGIRNNNPLNIEAGAFTKDLPGFNGSDGRFAKFSTPAQGIAAADKLLESYGSKGINTVEGVINRWAPATENNTGTYAQFVATKLGVKPGDKIDLADPTVRSQLVAAMGHYENGQPISAAGGPLTTSLNPDAERLQAVLPHLRTMRMLPGIPDTVAKGLDETIKNIEKENEATGEMKEYRLYTKQARETDQKPLSFFDWQIKMAQEKANKVSVTQTTKGEDKADQVMGERFGKKYGEMVDAGDKAFSNIGTISTMRELTKDPNFSSGILSEKVALPLKQIQVALGGDPKAAASMETFRSLANKSVLDTMGGSLGTGISNADRDFIVAQVPTLGNTPAGNSTLFNVMEKVERRKIDVARMAQEYVQQKGEDGKPRGRLDAGFDTKLSEWREKNPLFSEEERGEIKQIAVESLPKVGDEVDGWIYKGGDRSERKNWEKAPPKETKK